MGVLRHPIVLLAVAWVLLIAVSRLRRPTNQSLRVAPVAAAALIVLTYGAIVIWYALQTSYFDAAEPTITAVSAVFAAGHPLYPPLDAAERYVHVYGPMLFILQRLAFAIGGASILTSKCVGALAALVGTALAYRVYRQQAGGAAAIYVTAAISLVYFYFGNAAFWTRSDPLLILCTSVGLAAATSRRAVFAAVILGLATGTAMNLKVTGAAYLLPVFAIALSNHGLRVVSASVAVALVTAVVPFLSAQISLPNYLDYLRLSARNGLLGAKAIENAEWGLFLLAPLAAALLRARAPRFDSGLVRFAIATVAAMCAIGIVAAKPGGGAFHFLPFLPVLGHAVLALPDSVWSGTTPRRLAWAFVLAALTMAVPRQLVFVRTVADRHLDDAIPDVRRFADQAPSNRIAVGYAGTSHLSHARVELVFRTGEYLLDAPAVQEHRLSGLELPEATLRAIEDCRYDYWLLPQGAPAFNVPSAYRPLGPPDVFPEAFRSVFTRRYAQVGRTALFDVWRCQ